MEWAYGRKRKGELRCLFMIKILGLLYMLEASSRSGLQANSNGSALDAKQNVRKDSRKDSRKNRSARSEALLYRSVRASRGPIPIALEINGQFSG